MKSCRECTPDITVILRGGLTAVLRPLTRADREAYLICFEHVGPESRRRRFLNAKPSLSEAEITYFTNVDHHDHEAIIAVIRGAIVGVARFVRDRGDVGLAELAAVVADEWQRRGLGTALLGRLVERASEEGIERLRGTFFHGNAGILATIRRLGLAWRPVSPASSVTEIEITLPDPSLLGLPVPTPYTTRMKK
jgi:GNAT superfamily N-acetyltransferase